MKYNPTAPKVRPLVMGVLNTTPDSFSDGNKFLELQAALDHAKLLQMSGADIIDVGGESTRPGATRISVEEEQERVLPVIGKIVDADLGCAISIDTMNSETALAAVLLGATIINDVSGGLADENMFKVAAETKATLVISHWRGHADVMDTMSSYQNVALEVANELKERMMPESICLDFSMLASSRRFTACPTIKDVKEEATEIASAYLALASAGT